MSAPVAHQYGYLGDSLFKALIDFFNDDIRVALFDSDLVIDQWDHYFDAAPYDADQVANANGYSTGGVALATPSSGAVGLDIKLDFDDPEWTVTGGGFTYRYAVYYNNTPGSNKPLICWQDFGQDIVAIAGTHNIQLHPSGLLLLTLQ